MSDSVLLPSGDRPYLVSGADDKLAKVWDYQTKACVQTLEGHSHNVSAVCFHPELPVILTGTHPAQLVQSPVLLLLSPASVCRLWLQYAWLVASSLNRQCPCLYNAMRSMRSILFSAQLNFQSYISCRSLDNSQADPISISSAGIELSLLACRICNSNHPSCCFAQNTGAWNATAFMNIACGPRSCSIRMYSAYAQYSLL